MQMCLELPFVDVASYAGGVILYNVSTIFFLKKKTYETPICLVPLSLLLWYSWCRPTVVIIW
jgi:hypothetical protein